MTENSNVEATENSVVTLQKKKIKGKGYKQYHETGIPETMLGNPHDSKSNGALQVIKKQPRNVDVFVLHEDAKIKFTIEMKKYKSTSEMIAEFCKLNLIQSDCELVLLKDDKYLVVDLYTLKHCDTVKLAEAPSLLADFIGQANKYEKDL